MTSDFGFDAKIQRSPSIWNNRTVVEKFLLTLCLLTSIAVIALIITVLITVYANEYAVVLDNGNRVIRNIRSANNANENQNQGSNAIPQSSSPSQDDIEDICLTKGCIQASARIFESLDDSVDPCDNFYDFACGNFVKTTFLPDDKTNVDLFSILRDKVEVQLRAIINEETKSDQPRSFTLVKNLYKACMNTSIIEQRGLAPINDLIKHFGGWPVLLSDQWVETDWSWLKVLKKFRNIGMDTDVFFELVVTENLKNSSQRAVELDQTHTELNREILIRGISEQVVQAYYDLMVDIAVILGADKERAKGELLDVLNFEIVLAEISIPQAERRNLTRVHNPLSIKQLQEKYPYIPWLEFVNDMLPEGTTVDENEIVIVSVPTFFEKLGSILESTPKRTIANYLMWRFVIANANALTDNIRKRQQIYVAAVSGQKEEEPRWRECLQFASANAPGAVAALYVRKYFNEDAKKSALELVMNVRRSFVDILSRVSWMDDTTKNAALTKARALTNHIGYPDELADDKKLDEFHKGLEVEPDNYLLNGLKARKFDLDTFYSKLHEPVNKSEWIMHMKAAEVNAHYSPIENNIQFPAGILQDKFFSSERPHYLNYGAIGQFVGHEITHGFDDQGRQFDVNGNLAEWWQHDTKKKFLDKAKCIIDQYSAFREPTTNLTLNGVNSQGENIADNGGLKEAYNAYKTWVAENGAEKKLPGLPYAPKQLFWISSAQSWCAVARKEDIKLKIISAVHAPNVYRVLGPIANMRDFAIDFNCPEGSNMNPREKCEVW